MRNSETIVQISFSGSEKVIAALSQGVPRLREMLEDSLTRAAERVVAAAKAAAPKDTGNLMRSIRRAVKHEPGSVKGMAKVGVRYWRWVEFGSMSTKARKMPRWDRYAGVGPWAKRHGINPYLLARAIKNAGGVRARPFVYPAYDKEADNFLRDMDRVKEQFVREINDKINGRSMAGITAGHAGGI